MKNPLHSHSTQPIILVAGPTASGKSSAVLTLAQKLDGIIINADSMQVYKELRIITARPSFEDESRAPHQMYGHISGAIRYSTGRWAKDVRKQIDTAYELGKRPIIIGGTGLYFRALIDGMAVIPTVNEEISVYWRAQAQKLGAHELHKILTKQDPIMAERLKPSDSQRITRALEVLESTKQSLSYWQKQKDKPVLSDQERQGLLNIVIAPEREVLYQRINTRFKAMIDEGGLDEVRNLQDHNFDPALPLMRALGVPELTAYLKGQSTKEEAIELAQMLTRRYAKRQMTWLRKNMPEESHEDRPKWHWFRAPDKAKCHEQILSLPSLYPKTI